MGLGYVICMGMCGSGARIGMMMDIMRIVRVLIREALIEARTGLIAAAVGSVTAGSAGRLFAAANRPATAASTSASASPGRLSNAVHFYSFTL